MAVTLGIYYVLPWLRWQRAPSMPDQAVMFDVEHGRLFFFFLEIWPQEFYYITGLLVISALGLFLVTSAAGRVWCGYACPQTVWTDLMLAVERFWQGDRNARIRLDKEPWHWTKIAKKAMTHLSWLPSRRRPAALVFYFRDAPTSAVELVTGTRRRSPTCSSACSRSRPTCWAPSPASRSASTCARGRASRARWSTGIPCSSATARSAANRADPCERARAGPAAATASAARRASRSARPASTSATARRWNAFSARCASTCDDIMDRVGRPRGLIAYDTIAKQEAEGRGPARVDPARAAAHGALRRVHRGGRPRHAGRPDEPHDARDQRPARPRRRCSCR